MEKDIALMDLEDSAMNEMGWMEKDKYHMISCTCGISRKKSTTTKIEINS